MPQVGPVASRAPVTGWVDRRFTTVCEAFGQLLDDERETGAAVAVIRDGQLVLDLRGGWQDAARSRPWAPDTLTPLFCAGKPVAAVAVLMLASQGVIDVDAPVVRYWPSFATGGKDQVLVRHILTHSAGLPAFPIPRPAHSLPRWDVLAHDLAAAVLEWQPGTAVGEHALTFGHLLGEIVRRVDGRPLGVYLRDQIARPHNLDIALGLTPTQAARTADVEYSSPQWYELTVGQPFTVRQRALNNPNGCLDPHVLNSPWCRRASMPAVNIHATAPALAHLYASLAAGSGPLDSDLTAAMTTAHVHGYDLVLDRPIRRGLGVTIEADNQWGIAAIGGNLVAVNPSLRQTFVYLTRRLGDHTAAQTILNATRSCG
ncbi:beta-lactamase family protein [Micromonospora sp. CPCC 205371]|nr:beta-lactamase family protein [Micromonospora sp. CPCC 205371]